MHLILPDSSLSALCILSLYIAKNLFFSKPTYKHRDNSISMSESANHKYRIKKSIFISLQPSHLIQSQILASV